MTLAEPPAQPRMVTVWEWAEENATRAERRAVKARKHASDARAQAEQDAVRDDRYGESLHRREAELHEGAAARQLEAATIQRNRAVRLRLSVPRELT